MKRKRIIAISAVALAIAAGWYLVGTKWWQRSDFDKDWSERTVRAAQPLLAAIEQFHGANGQYPTSLSELGIKIEAPPSHPISGATKWQFERLAPSAFEIYVPCQNWVSSFDALVFRSVGTYPPQWSNLFDSHHVFAVEEWHYVTGYSYFAQHRRNP